MEKIPIRFDYKGKQYAGYFTKVFGAGANVWHLMIDNYYYGALQLTENYRWASRGNHLAVYNRG